MSSASMTPARLLLALFLTAVLSLALWWHGAILAPFILSVALAFVLRPMVDTLERWRCPRSVGAVLILLGLMLMAILVGLLLVPIASDLLPMLRDRLPDLLFRLWDQVAPQLRRWGADVPQDTAALKDELRSLLQANGAQWGARVWTSLLAGGSSALNLVGLLTLIPLLTFYWLLDWPRLAPKWLGLMPLRWQPAWHELMGECDALMGQYMRGQLLVMVILAVYYGLGLSLFGFKMGWPIGVLTGLAICIPYLGFGAGLVLALSSGLLQFMDAPGGVGHALVGVSVVYGLGQVVESVYLTPRLVGERIGLHPLGVILALMLFGQWMGLWGVIVALPCAAFFMVLARRGWRLYVQSGFYGRA
jgi:predicted PurR-regulated permease PerM